MTDHEDVEWYIHHGREERYLEYKGPMTWKDDGARVEIAKAIMAMSNLKDGGVVVIGITERRKGEWIKEGITPEDAASFNRDDIAEWVNDRVVPATQFTVQSITLDGKLFIVIEVQEFERIPLVCQKPFSVRGKEVLKRGGIYCRSKRKNQSAPVASEEDMRDLIEIAVSKGVALQMQQLREIGCLPLETHVEESDRSRFEEERGGL